MIKNLFLKFNKLEFHVKGILLSIPLTTFLLVYLLANGAADLIFSEWFISFISVAALASNLLSMSAHFGRALDVLKLKQKKLNFHDHKKEYTGTAIGIVIGLAIGIGFTICNFFIPMAASIGIFANIIFTLRQMNVYAGLGNRIGRIGDPKSRPLSEKIIVGLSIALGIALGIAMIVTSNAALVSLLGMTAFMIGGPTLPIWLGSIIFLLSVTSIISSAADYIAKGVNFIRAKYSKDPELLERVERFKFDYAGSLVGVVVGLTLGAIVVACLCLSSPYILPGVVGVVSCGLLMVATTSMFGCFFSQYGRVIDSARRIAKEEAEENKKAVTPAVTKPLDIKVDIKPVPILTPIKPQIIKAPTPSPRPHLIYLQRPASRAPVLVDELKDSALYQAACAKNNNDLPSKEAGLEKENISRRITPKQSALKFFEEQIKANNARPLQPTSSTPSRLNSQNLVANHLKTN